MKTLILSIAATVTASTAFAGGSYISATPSDSNAEGALLLLLVVGGIILLNGGLGAGSNRAKAPEADANDDDVIMKF